MGFEQSRVVPANNTPPKYYAPGMNPTDCCYPVALEGEFKCEDELPIEEGNTDRGYKKMAQISFAFDLLAFFGFWPLHLVSVIISLIMVKRNIIPASEKTAVIIMSVFEIIGWLFLPSFIAVSTCDGDGRNCIWHGWVGLIVWGVILAGCLPRAMFTYWARFNGPEEKLRFAFSPDFSQATQISVETSKMLRRYYPEIVIFDPTAIINLPVGSWIGNIDGTSGDKRGGSSWIGWWRKNTGLPGTACCIANSRCNTIVVGGHCYVGTSNNWYIINICNAHNAKTWDGHQTMQVGVATKGCQIPPLIAGLIREFYELKAARELAGSVAPVLVSELPSFGNYLKFSANL